MFYAARITSFDGGSDAPETQGFHRQSPRHGPSPRSVRTDPLARLLATRPAQGPRRTGPEQPRRRCGQCPHHPPTGERHALPAHLGRRRRRDPRVRACCGPSFHRHQHRSLAQAEPVGAGTAYPDDPGSVRHRVAGILEPWRAARDAHFGARAAAHASGAASRRLAIRDRTAARPPAPGRTLDRDPGDGRAPGCAIDPARTPRCRLSRRRVARSAPVAGCEPGLRRPHVSRPSAEGHHDTAAALPGGEAHRIRHARRARTGADPARTPPPEPCIAGRGGRRRQ